MVDMTMRWDGRNWSTVPVAHPTTFALSSLPAGLMRLEWITPITCVGYLRRDDGTVVAADYVVTGHDGSLSKVDGSGRAVA